MGFLASVFTGLCMPVWIVVFGQVIDEFDSSAMFDLKPDQVFDSIKVLAIIMVVFGTSAWLFAFMQFSFLGIFAEKATRRLRKTYLKALFQQDCTWYDNCNYTELSSRLSEECRQIEKAIGEKQGLMLQGLAMGFSGIIISIYKGWTFGLVLLFLLFPIIGMMIINVKVTSKGIEESLKAYGQSAGYADQALNAIKVVVAFG
jgi:ATP-binding cassette subfamily B (MDR/TAP) protein 1